MSRPATPSELLLAQRIFPDLDPSRCHVEEGGQFHRVLILAPHAVIRMARTSEASAQMPRSVALHNQLAQLLPVPVPRQLGPLVQHEGQAAVALSYLPGAAHRPHTGDAEILRGIVTMLAEAPLDELRPLLSEPFAFRGPWTDGRIAASYDALPAELKEPATLLWDQLPMLAQAPVGLVHGDLAGHNMHWLDGRLCGILDWDLAAAWDPALNTAYLCLWHGQHLIDRVAPDAEQAHRARIWLGLMSLERFSDTISRTDNPRLDKLLRKIGPRILSAAAALA